MRHYLPRLLPAVLLACLSATAAAASQPGAAAGAHINASGLTSRAGYDRFIVRYRDGSAGSAAVQRFAAALGRIGTAAAGKSPPGASYVRRLATGAQLLRTSRKLSSAEAAALLARLAADPQVSYAAPDYRRQAIKDIRALTPVLPDDPQYAKEQWHFRAPDGSPEAEGSGTVSNYGGANVANAWNLADGSGITVAVLDTGITVHPDLDTSLAADGYDFISNHELSGRDVDGRIAGGWDTGDWTDEEPWLSDCSNGRPESSSWHGTHVAGTIAESTGNGVGLAGIAGKAKLLPVRVLGHCGGDDSDIADAIIWAAGGHVDGVPDNQHPAQVINLSLGGGGTCSAEDPLGEAIAQANRLGATVVVAAGNSGDDAANYSPASCPGALTVAATGITSQKAFYSNYGARVDLAAPGGGVYPNDGDDGDPVDTGFVWSAINQGTTVPAAPAYGGYAGTSQATPHVSGIVALLQSARLANGLDLLGPEQVRSVLRQTAHAPRVASSGSQSIGAGIVDAYAAVSKAVAGDDYVATLSNGVAATGVQGSASDTLYYQVEVPAGAKALVLRTFGGNGDVSLYVKLGAKPGAGDYDYASAHVGNNEAVSLARPAAGTYYLEVVGAKDFANLSVQASFIAPAQ